jgi:hypothetical protein
LLFVSLLMKALCVLNCLLCGKTKTVMFNIYVPLTDNGMRVYPVLEKKSHI